MRTIHALGWVMGVLVCVHAAIGAEGGGLPRGVLEELYRKELGTLYNAGEFDRLHEAHRLIEAYFATSSAKERAEIVEKLQAIGLDANVLGRMARIRLSWAEVPGNAYHINERVGPFAVHYFVSVPAKYDRAASWPMLIRLPAEKAFVTEPRPNAEQIVRLHEGWIREEAAKHPDTIVVMPVVDPEELYEGTYSGMNGVIQAMHHAAGKLNVDPARVSMLGHSMGAHVVWNLALHHPTYFSAIGSLAGGAPGEWQRLRMMNLMNVLPVVWHDAGDTVIKVGQSQALVRILKQFKIEVDYEESKGVGHDPTPAIFDKVAAKLLARKRPLYPQQVLLQSNRPETPFNRSDWVQVYQPSAPGPEKRLLFRNAPGFMRVNQTAHRVDARVAGPNRIEIIASNVEVMRVYLNDQMVDLARPVTVVVNKQVRFEGVVPVSIGEMLADQVFLGRGWRYFTGVIDLDLSGQAATATSGPATEPAAGGAGPGTRGNSRE